MKVLVVFFSQTGWTKKVAEVIAGEENADLEEIVESKKRYTRFGWILLSGREGMFKEKSKIEKPKYNPNDYDLTYVGSPVWGFNLVPAVRSYLTESRIIGKKVALFCTSGGLGWKRTLNSMRELTENCEVVGELTIKSPISKDDLRRVRTWVNELKEENK